MKPRLIICAAALTVATLLPEPADAQRGVRRSRVVITAPRYRYFDEPGVIYGYAPGVYVPGPNGMLYGPYRTRTPYVSFGPEGPDFFDWRNQ